MNSILRCSRQGECSKTCVFLLLRASVGELLDGMTRSHSELSVCREAQGVGVARLSEPLPTSRTSLRFEVCTPGMDVPVL